jgi:hypothetical protein
MIFDATNSKEGKILIGYDLIPLSDKAKVILYYSLND